MVCSQALERFPFPDNEGTRSTQSYLVIRGVYATPFELIWCAQLGVPNWEIYTI